jgi:hypothetical protein
MTVQRNSLRGLNPLVVSIPQLRGTSDIQPCETVKKYCTNEGTSPDPDGVNYARPLKVTKAERFSKGALRHVLSYLSLLGFRQKAKSCLSLAKDFYLNKGNVTFNGI